MPQAPMQQYGGYQPPPRELPRPVHTASILLFVAGGFALLGGLALLALSTRVRGAVVADGVLVLVLGAFEIYVGIQLRRLRPWARAAALAVASTAALLQLLAVLGGNVPSLLGLGLDAAIIYYLMRPETVVAFRRRFR